MKKYVFDVPLYDIDVVLLQVEGSADAEEVVSELKKYDVTDDIEQEVREAVGNDRTDGASTFWNSGLHVAVVVFYKMESEERALVCYAHEKRHVEDRILQFCGIEDVEASAYLAGYLAKYFFELWKK